MKLSLHDLHMNIIGNNKTYDVFDYIHNRISFCVILGIC